MDVKKALKRIENFLKELSNLTDSKKLVGKEELDTVKDRIQYLEDRLHRLRSDEDLGEFE